MGFYPISPFSRKLGTAGQKLGGAAVLCHIKHDPVDPGGPFTLTSANVGKCQTVLCRDGKPLPLARSYVMSCEEELKRIKRHKAIITEVRKRDFPQDGGGRGQDRGRISQTAFPTKGRSLNIAVGLKLKFHIRSSTEQTLRVMCLETLQYTE